MCLCVCVCLRYPEGKRDFGMINLFERADIFVIAALCIYKCTDISWSHDQHNTPHGSAKFSGLMKEDLQTHMR